MSRMVNLTTLAPDIVAAILDETLPEEVTLFELAAGTPVLWIVPRLIYACDSATLGRTGSFKNIEFRKGLQAHSSKYVCLNATGIPRCVRRWS